METFLQAFQRVTQSGVSDPNEAARIAQTQVDEAKAAADPSLAAPSSITIGPDVSAEIELAAPSSLGIVATIEHDASTEVERAVSWVEEKRRAAIAALHRDASVVAHARILNGMSLADIERRLVEAADMLGHAID